LKKKSKKMKKIFFVRVFTGLHGGVEDKSTVAEGMPAVFSLPGMTVSRQV
jgi:hypothetical protein